MDSASLPYEVLDLTLDGLASSALCRRTMTLLGNAKRVIVVVGAGISVATGIPDFRSPTGLFSTLRADTKFKPSGKALFDASVYKSETGTQSYNEMISSLHSLTNTATPSSFHRFLDKISPRLLRIYTQNIDSLENRFPSLSTTVPLPSKAPWPKTIQLHGDLNHAVCSKCRWIGPLDPSQLLSGTEMGCVECREADSVREIVGKRCQGVGIIRPRVVLYNEPNPDADAIGAVSNADIRSRPPPDLVLVVGTSLKIPGTKRIVRESINAVHHTPRGKAMWINLDPPPSKDYDVWIKGDCQQIPGLYEDFERIVEEEKLFNEMKLKRKEEEKVQAERDRIERKERDRIRKEENERIRLRRKEEKEIQRAERERKEEERKRLKAEKEAKKARNAIQAAIRPLKHVKKEEKSWSRPLTPPSSYDTDSTLSSPSLSDIEFASFVESENKTMFPITPSVKRVFEYLPTPASTPQKGSNDYAEQDSPLKNKKRRMHPVEEMKSEFGNDNVMSGQHRNSMSIKFLTE